MTDRWPDEVVAAVRQAISASLRDADCCDDDPAQDATEGVLEALSSFVHPDMRLAVGVWQDQMQRAVDGKLEARAALRLLRDEVQSLALLVDEPVAARLLALDGLH